MVSRGNYGLKALLDWYIPGDEWTWEEEFAHLEEIHGDYLNDLIEDIRTNGITEPIQIGPDDRVWDGHHRLYAAKHLGLAWVPVDFVSGLTATIAST